MATLTFSGLPSGVVKTSMDNVTYTEATSPITLINGMYIWVSSSWSPIGKPTTYVNSVYVNENENDVWSNSRENPFILTYGGVLNYTTSSTQTATSAFVAKYVEQPKTTLDLSTLSDIAVGTHTVKVKAKASGYNDSEFSNEVSYTKAPSGYSGTVTNKSSGEYDIAHWENDGWHNDAMEVTGTQTLSGGSKYMISTSSNINKYRVTSYTNCTYELAYNNTAWVITPSDNNFTFVFIYAG